MNWTLRYKRLFIHLSKAFIRLMDIGLSTIALCALAPLFCLVIPLLRVTGENQIFYIQQRIGRGDKPFGLYKFATMVMDAPAIGTRELTLPNDPRVLPVGYYLRKTKINELPQLFNVLRGDMSLVGPRPQTRSYHDLYTKELRDRLNSIRPGLSGIGSIIFRDEETILSNRKDPRHFDETVMAPYKSALELWFVENAGVKMYFKVILATLLVVIFPRFNARRFFFATLPPPPRILESSLGRW